MFPNVSEIYARLCHSPAFTWTMAHWGGWAFVQPFVLNGTLQPGHWWPRNFSLEYTPGNASRISFPSTQMVAIFQFSFVAVPNSSVPVQEPCRPCLVLTYWAGDLWNNSLSGPTATATQLVCACGPVFATPPLVPFLAEAEITVGLFLAASAVALAVTLGVLRVRRSR